MRTLISSDKEFFSLPSFETTLANVSQSLNRQVAPSILQINVGKLCNLACHHCHVEAGPNRTEIMEKATIDRLITVLDNSPSITTVDLTGGAPELNPFFKELVIALKQRNLHIINRCNLTVLTEVGQEDTARFLADNHVEIVASLPCYSELNVDKQRGKGSFSKSIIVLQMLNQLGYGRQEQLPLNLVYNPIGASLPPAQDILEQDYRERLAVEFDIHFNHLLTITNMPIKRFEHQLIREKGLNDYMQLLFDNFNAQAGESIMCRDLVSISWDGKLYDCDFNQMLEMPIENQFSLWDINSFNDIANLAINTESHCYGCTAGSGSSCSGATA